MNSDIRVYIDNSRVEFEQFTFNGGEEHVKFPQELNPPHNIQVMAYIKDSAGIMQLAMIKDALDGLNWDGVPISLRLPYIPYARQDRRCDHGEAFGLKTFANILNGMAFSSVTVSDPHSDVAPALINNSQVFDQLLGFSQMDMFRGGFDSDDTIICAPDGGAIKKAYKVAERFSKEFISAEKIRDVKTGQILHTQVNCGDLTGKTVWMVDDICDGSMTFMKLAEALKDKGAKEVNLYITHGIFSKGKEGLINAGVTNIISKYDWTKDEMF